MKLFLPRHEIERKVGHLAAPERKTIRRDKTKLIAYALHQWLTQQRQMVPDGSATAKAIDHSLKHWTALVLFIDGGDLSINNKWANALSPVPRSS